jgi:hypothetical protein
MTEVHNLDTGDDFEKIVVGVQIIGESRPILFVSQLETGQTRSQTGQNRSTVLKSPSVCPSAVLDWTASLDLGS